MVERIKRHGLLKGVREISNKEVKEKIKTIRRKATHNGGKLDRWMINLDFRKEYRQYFEDGSYAVFQTGAANTQLWWVRE